MRQVPIFAMQWYYGSNNTQFGPVPESEIQRRLQSGELRLTDMVWREGMADWVSCASVPEFAMFRAPAGPVGGAFVSPYAPPQFQGGAYPVKSNSSLAVGSLVMGILGLLLCQLLSIGGVICGHMALNEINRSEGRLSGRGMAISGLVTGYIGVAIFVVFVLIFFAGAMGSVAGGRF